MTTASLSTASTYLNNLLLARGLLQDGRNIDFAHPGDNNTTYATMSRIINLVHDLVIRRDREAEQRENIVSNLRSLRADDAQRLLDLQKAQAKNAELTRDLTTTQAQERTLKTAVKSADTQLRDLKEQTLKMKSTLDQVRAKCIGDVRKRAVELEKLKVHLASKQRGKRENLGMKVNTINPQAFAGRQNRTVQENNPSDWSLEKETNDFLAALVNETSTENVSLRSIVTNTMDVLKELTGLEADPATDLEDDLIGIPGQYRPSRRHSNTDSIIACETLASQMTAILEHCRTILKDPSFVPIEELQIREEEIIKLRIGWEKMANRWKEAVTMMGNWRKRMLQGKEAIDMNELSSLEFGRSMAVMPNGQPVLDNTDELSAILFDHSRLSTEDEIPDINEPQVPAPDFSGDEESDLEMPMEPPPKRLAASPARRGIILQKPTHALRETDSNARPQPDSRTGHMALMLDGAADDEENIPAETATRMPKHHKGKDSPVMSVSEKLAAVEAEAREAKTTRKADGTHKRKPVVRGLRKNARRRSTLSPEELALLMGVR